MNKFSLNQFKSRYGTHDQCLDALKKARFPEPYACSKCKKSQKFYPVKGRTAYACNSCGNHIYPLVGTIFEKSTTPLDQWFFAMYLMTQTRAGTSAKQLERMLGVTYKTAWRMMKQIRMIMDQDDKNILDGIVEVDESFFGSPGKNRAYEWNQGRKKKEVIMGMVQRQGSAYLKHIPNTTKGVLIKQIKNRIDSNAHVMTDSYPAYKSLSEVGYFKHYVVDHAAREYVRNKLFHTNSVEGLWGRIKPAIRGVYRKVSSKYLESYMDEYTFRYNNRKNPMMFEVLLNQATSLKVLSAEKLV